jgi:murein L,D-transpeptidase YafK
MSTKNKDYQFKANWKISDSDNIKVPVSNKNKSLSSVAVYNQKNPITSKSVAMTSIYNEVERSNRNIDLVLVRKSLHRMELIKNNKVFKHYHVALGKNPVGKKEYRSDNRTPEGRYTLDYKKPYSQYHLAVHISYPNNEDLKQARKNKVDPGGLIFIHGQPNEIGRENDDGDDGNINFNKFIQPSNWTNGCIALINSDMHEFYNIVQEGTPIIILPSSVNCN